MNLINFQWDIDTGFSISLEYRYLGESYDAEIINEKLIKAFKDCVSTVFPNSKLEENCGKMTIKTFNSDSTCWLPQKDSRE